MSLRSLRIARVVIGKLRNIEKLQGTHSDYTNLRGLPLTSRVKIFQPMRADPQRGMMLRYSFGLGMLLRP